jgi:hypothetical protein
LIMNLSNPKINLISITTLFQQIKVVKENHKTSAIAKNQWDEWAKRIKSIKTQQKKKKKENSDTSIWKMEDGRKPVKIGPPNILSEKQIKQIMKIRDDNPETVILERNWNRPNILENVEIKQMYEKKRNEKLKKEKKVGLVIEIANQIGLPINISILHSLINKINWIIITNPICLALLKRKTPNIETAMEVLYNKEVPNKIWAILASIALCRIIGINVKLHNTTNKYELLIYNNTNKKKAQLTLDMENTHS